MPVEVDDFVNVRQDFNPGREPTEATVLLFSPYFATM
jgi:hypothetical protein